MQKIIEKIREKRPLVHCITNYVTVNDCANALLAIGASPVMADDIREVVDIVSIADSLVLNIGTLNARTAEAMIVAGLAAKDKGIPVIFDPVGAGASRLRTETAFDIINKVRPSVIRGNASEILTLCGSACGTVGVDAASGVAGVEEACVLLSEKNGCVAIATGIKDTVAFGKKRCIIGNGVAEMSRISGTGCMLSAVLGAFCASYGDIFEACAAAVASIGLCGELAFAKTNEGTYTFRNNFIDAVSSLNDDIFERGKRIEYKK